MKVKIIFDVEVIGNSYKINETGIFRVAYELFKGFRLNKETELYFSSYNFNNHKETQLKIDRFFFEHKILPQYAVISERIKFIPFRKEKLFKKIYRKLGLQDYRICYNKNLLEKSQIYHSVYYPIDKSLNSHSHIKKVVTIHDLIPILFPEFNDNTQLLKDTIKSIGKDNYAICVSENTRKDLLEYDPKIDPDKVFVSKLAASSEIFYPCKDSEKIEEIRKKYNISEKYFLSLSTLEPRKNIDHLIRSFVKMVTTYQVNDINLVLVGSKGWNYDKIFEEFNNAKYIKDKIVITGRVPDEELASLYSNANSFYYMSLYEGFGLPPLEAMQCGVATVTSDTSSLPEVLGDAGILLDPTDEDALAETMWKLYNDKALNKHYAEKALVRASGFSWKKTVDDHINIYKKILND